MKKKQNCSCDIYDVVNKVSNETNIKEEEIINKESKKCGGISTKAVGKCDRPHLAPLWGVQSKEKKPYERKAKVSTNTRKGGGCIELTPANG